VRPDYSENVPKLVDWGKPVGKKYGKNYIPEKGDIVWVNLDPAMGHEQKGRRPAVVVSATDYNNKTGLCLACPTTKVLKPYPFYVNLSEEQKTKGSVLSDQVVY
jgi:mRNA interferase MazF